MAVTINQSTFPAEGGTFTIQITKDSNRVWNISNPSAAWISNVIGLDQSNHLYELTFDLSENTGVSNRSTTFTAGDDLDTETFTLTQYGTGTTLSAEIIAVTPSSNIAASGGQITVDVEARNGVDSGTSASISVGGLYTTLTSTTHGLSSGGYTVTRFVFTVDANSGTSTRAITLNFTVQDASFNYASTSLNKTQNGLAVQTGTLSATDANIMYSDLVATSLLTYTDMQMETVSATSNQTWATDPQINIQGGQYVCSVTTTQNTGAGGRNATITLTGTDNWGNTITATFTIRQSGNTHAIEAAWDNGDTMTFVGGTLTATVTYTGTFTGSLTIVSAPGVPTGMAVTTNGSTEVRVYWDGGTIPQTTTIPITIRRTGDDNRQYTVTLYLILAVGGVFPIWEDVYGTITSGDDWEDYELSEGGSPFYAGRAFKYPDENGIYVNVSRVVAPYLTTYFKDVVMTSGGLTVGSFTFVRDYSYDPSIDYSQNQPLSFPINGLVPSGVVLEVSEWAAASGGALQVTDEGGTLVVNEVLQKGLNSATFITGVEGKTYTFGNERFRVVSVCSGALLKYVNAYGGWDYFLVEGVTKQTDKITRASYEKDADALSSQFESKDYQATMEATWKGSTGWLTDSQSARMKHLVESVEVYMVDMNSGNLIPVCMRDTNLEYKTFMNNGRKLVNYTLQWSESQKKMRR